MRTAISRPGLLLGLCLGLLPAASLPAETYMLLVETTLDGLADPSPPAIEGLMSALFESGQVSFDCGPYSPEADWQNLQFQEPMEIAFQGGAHYLATVRLQARTLPVEGDGPPAFSVQARFQLWKPPEGALLGDGSLELDNRARERQLPYEALLLRAGELAAGELRRIAVRR
jgi:hypothetical protein